MFNFSKYFSLLTKSEVNKLSRYILSREVDSFGFIEVNNDKACLRVFKYFVKNSYLLAHEYTRGLRIGASCSEYALCRKDNGNCPLNPKKQLYSELLECQLMYKNIFSTLVLNLDESLVWSFLSVYGSEGDFYYYSEIKDSLCSVIKDYKYSVKLCDKSNDSFVLELSHLYINLLDLMFNEEILEKYNWVYCHRPIIDAILFRECLLLGVSPIIISYKRKNELETILMDSSNMVYRKLCNFLKDEQAHNARFFRRLRIV